MNTTSQKDPKNNAPVNPWDDLLAFKNESDEISHDAQMLMFSFLGEIEKFQELRSINRKSLAEKIKTSASYITQLFRGNKPLNFVTIAKAQKALGIKFKINAVSTENVSITINMPQVQLETAPEFDFNKNGGSNYLSTIKGGKFPVSLTDKSISL